MTEFQTDVQLAERLRGVEASLRGLIRAGVERPFVEVGAAADELAAVACILDPAPQA